MDHCTAASGADQCCSLPDSPGRPCAAKSAPMARRFGGVICSTSGCDRLPVVVRFPAGPRVRLKTVELPKGNGLGQKNAPPLGEGNHTEKSASDEPIFTDVALYASTGSRR